MSNKIDLDEYAYSFCNFFYQSRRGKLHAQHEEIEEAIYSFVYDTNDFSQTDRDDLENKVRKIIINNDCMYFFKTKWNDVYEEIKKITDEYLNKYEDDDSISKIYDCIPNMFSITILELSDEDTQEFENFIKDYYDICKQTSSPDYISNAISQQERFIIELVKDSIIIALKEDPKTTYCYNELHYEVPTKKDIIHLLNIYKKTVYNDSSLIQSVFKRIYQNENLSLSKADKPKKRQKQPSDNEWEL